MKNMLNVSVFFAFVMIFVSCSGPTEEEKAKARFDSIKQAENDIIKQNGGFVIQLNDGHKIAVSKTDLGQFNWDKANQACEELELNGFSDWRLPTEEELEYMYRNKNEIGNFATGKSIGSDCYWSTRKGSCFLDCYYFINFSTGEKDFVAFSYNLQARPVRSL